MSYAGQVKNSKILDDVKSGSVVQANRKLVGCSILPDSNGNVVISSGTTEIAPYAFDGCQSLKSVTFESPSTVTSIGEHAFSNTLLENIVVPSSVYNLGSQIFSDSSIHTLEFEDPVHAEFAFTYDTLTGTDNVNINFPASSSDEYTTQQDISFQGGTNVDINVAEIVCPPQPIGAISTDDTCGWMLPDNSPYGAMRDHISLYSEEPIKFESCPQYTGYNFNFPITMVGLRRVRGDVNAITKHHNVVITFYNPGGPESFAQAERDYKAVSLHLKVKSKKVTNGVSTPFVKKYYKLLDKDGDFTTTDGYFFDVVMPAGLIKMDRVKKFKAVLKFHSLQNEVMVASCGMATRNSRSRGISSFASFPYTTGMLHDTNMANRNYEEQCLKLTAGNKVSFSNCNHYTGDTYLRLWRGADDTHAASQVFYNDDACALGSALSYQIPLDGTYCLRMGCYSSGSCSMTIQYYLNDVLQT